MRIFLLLIMLTGCASDPIKVPIPITCQTPVPAAPNYTFEQLSKDDNLYLKVRSLLSDRELSMAYEIELAAALASCK